MQFLEKADKMENIEDSTLSNYKEILPNTEITCGDARSFWQKEFGKGDATDNISCKYMDIAFEDDLWDAMLYRDESAFDFNGVVDEKTKEVLELFDSDTWETFDVDERYELIEKLANCIGESLGLENQPEIELVDLKDNCSGFYSERGNYIGININYWDDYKDVVDTVAHEMRHAYQRYRANICENSQDELYKFNFEHYISAERDTEGNYIHFKEYYEQYIEVEARAFAKEFAAEVA